jgi:hypothetical protein
MPSPQTPVEKTLTELQAFYLSLSRDLMDFLAGLASWDALDEKRREAGRAHLRTQVPALAVRRYQDPSVVTGAAAAGTVLLRVRG